MRIKNIKILSIALFSIIILSACTNEQTTKKVPMDQLAEDNLFHYSNEKSAFSVDFPEQFIYYQTQRKDTKKYEEVQFFVPTSDRDYPQEIQSYAKFLSVRVYRDEDYEKEDNFVEFSKRDGKKYIAIFWDVIPKDWSDKWDESVKKDIVSSFKLN